VDSEWKAVEENPRRKLENHGASQRGPDIGFFSLDDTDDPLFPFEDGNTAGIPRSDDPMMEIPPE
jgi:hypothetical protein